jgi:hypothetical protein
LEYCHHEVAEQHQLGEIFVKHAGVSKVMVGSKGMGSELKHGGAAGVSKISAGEREAGIVSQESNMLLT